MNLIHLLCFLASLSLGLGIFFPSLQINPRYGEFTGTVELLAPEMGEAQVFSIASGVWQLFLSGNFFVALVLLVFSIIFPVWKLGVIWSGYDMQRRGLCPDKAFTWVSHLGKFSMLDIYVIALLVLVLKGMPGGSEIKVQAGVMFFTFSVVISILTHLLVKKSKLNQCGPSE